MNILAMAGIAYLMSVSAAINHPMHSGCPEGHGKGEGYHDSKQAPEDEAMREDQRRENENED